MGDVLAEVLTMLVVIVGFVFVADRLLWRRYWRKRGIVWSEERQALVKMGKVTRAKD